VSWSCVHYSEEFSSNADKLNKNLQCFLLFAGFIACWDNDDVDFELLTFKSFIFPQSVDAFEPFIPNQTS
jgi:hypothetical protein